MIHQVYFFLVRDINNYVGSFKKSGVLSSKTFCLFVYLNLAITNPYCGNELPYWLEKQKRRPERQKSLKEDH
jgi:hypothetical protein